MLKKLRQIGLTEYEAKAYLALLKFGVQQCRKVAKHSGVPPTRVFDTLHSLVAKGFASRVQDKPLLFKAIKPEIAITNTIKQRQEDLRILKEDLLSQLKNITPKFPQPKVVEKISVLPGYEPLWSFVENALKEAKREVKLMFTYEQRPYRILPLYKKAVDRGVKVKIIATKITEAGMQLIKEHIKLGIDVKFYPVQEIRIAIKDGKETLITMLNPRDRHDRVNIIIQSKELSKALDYYFKSIWKKARIIS